MRDLESDSLAGFAPGSASRVLRALVLAFVALGLLARAVRYLPAWEPWGDETALMANVIQRSYADLLAPLDYQQVAPVGYLWAAKAMTQLLGVHELSLRGIAFVASVLTLLLMVRIARAATQGWATLLAVGILAVSNYHVRHAAEMKQYALEALVTAALIALGLATARARAAAAWGLLALTPLAMFFSLPAVFVLGGLALALLPEIYRRGSARWWGWYGAFLACIGVSFLALYLAVLQPQFARHFTAMDQHWGDQMPRFASLTDLARWLVRSATGSIFAHPLGGENGESIPFVVLFWVGVAAMWRGRDFYFLRLLAGVFALAILAALLRKYPLGGHPRTALYLSPLVIVPIAAGAAWLIRWSARDARATLHRGVVALAVLAVIGVAGIAKDLAKPYHSLTARSRRDFARWFWTDFRASSPGPLAAVLQDGSFLPVVPREYAYLRARYQRDAGAPLPAIPDHVDQRTGLVVCGMSSTPEYQAILQRWRDALAQKHQVLDHQVFHVNPTHPRFAHRYDVLWIAPRAAGDGPAPDPR